MYVYRIHPHYTPPLITLVTSTYHSLALLLSLLPSSIFLPLLPVVFSPPHFPSFSILPNSFTSLLLSSLISTPLFPFLFTYYLKLKQNNTLLLESTKYDKVRYAAAFLKYWSNKGTESNETKEREWIRSKWEGKKWKEIEKEMWKTGEATIGEGLDIVEVVALGDQVWKDYMKSKGLIEIDVEEEVAEEEENKGKEISMFGKGSVLGEVEEQGEQEGEEDREAGRRGREMKFEEYMAKGDLEEEMDVDVNGKEENGGEGDVINKEEEEVEKEVVFEEDESENSNEEEIVFQEDRGEKSNNKLKEQVATKNKQNNQNKKKPQNKANNKNKNNRPQQKKRTK
eukprot:TRINITY_DN1478_c0_g1_i1.p1 TRINITY_DN1478_c0_g1~~TRINITY_DN1478_c0_g1_i1.p1  ORF type:complete len:340 (+),score=157.33 TRINITY_DN1478_c0_g1_i1:703-1722(+)